MSTFEALKLAYVRSTKKDEPGVLATLAFGSLSGSVGATVSEHTSMGSGNWNKAYEFQSVYPLNLVRTRLQASGSSGHPQVYTGVWDVTKKTYASDGIRGFYRGLLPSLAKVCSEEFSCQIPPLTLYKVVPAVSISYVVYEQTKKQYVTLGSCILFVQMQTYHSPLVLQAWRLNASTFRNFVIDGPVVYSLALFPSCIDLANIVLVIAFCISQSLLMCS